MRAKDQGLLSSVQYLLKHHTGSAANPLEMTDAVIAPIWFIESVIVIQGEQLLVLVLDSDL